MNDWISVKDRLPDNPDEFVLVIVSSRDGFLVNTYQLATYNPDDGWILETWPEKENIAVQYWMPLPEPPET